MKNGRASQSFFVSLAINNITYSIARDWANKGVTGLVTVGSVTTFTQAGLPEAKARSSAGIISSSLVTYSP